MDKASGDQHATRFQTWDVHQFMVGFDWLYSSSVDVTESSATIKTKDILE